MAAETFATLLAQLGALPSAETVSLSGFGEPLLHPQFCDFLSQVKRAGLRAELITNGTLLSDRVAERLVDEQLDRLAVSTDGPQQDATDPFHTGALAQVQDNLRALCRLKQRRRAERPAITLVFVASRRNIGQLPAVQRLAEELGATDVLVSNLIPNTRALHDEVLYQQWGTTRRNAPAAPWNPVIRLPRIDLRAEAGRVVALLCSSGKHVQLGDAAISGGRMECRFVSTGCVAIRPEGDVSPCLPLLHTHRYYFRGDPRRTLAYRVGNIHQTPLAQIWAGGEYRAFRDRVRRFEFSPCIDCCGCHFRETNQEDCYGSVFPRCGECLWAAGLVQCP
jgi:MoaA/NifB/PqqE/SkfB family radical SAM enzyme